MDARSRSGLLTWQHSVRKLTGAGNIHPIGSAQFHLESEMALAEAEAGVKPVRAGPGGI